MPTGTPAKGPQMLRIEKPNAKSPKPGKPSVCGSITKLWKYPLKGAVYPVRQFLTISWGQVSAAIIRFSASLSIKIRALWFLQNHKTRPEQPVVSDPW
jgi:hypothetical protein